MTQKFYSHCEQKYPESLTFVQCLVLEGYKSAKYVASAEDRGYWTMDDKEALMFLLKWS